MRRGRCRFLCSTRWWYVNEKQEERGSDESCEREFFGLNGSSRTIPFRKLTLRVCQPHDDVKKSAIGFRGLAGMVCDGASRTRYERLDVEASATEMRKTRTSGTVRKSKRCPMNFAAFRSVTFLSLWSLPTFSIRRLCIRQQPQPA